MCAIGQLGPLLSEKVIRQWLDKKGRALTNYQVKKSMVHDLPINIKMLSYCVESVSELSQASHARPIGPPVLRPQLAQLPHRSRLQALLVVQWTLLS